ncbi:hypothetical protein B296_00014948 [Ensete ventricosum]|uniref:Uncharacterized protein n=1 Tax=Ensete ventricosum TaxID=4639 RepID=A0A426ZAZ6_ENSVE|nr:hypothetical protein B296_00014948 [Ensete ventricosum]
MAACRAADEVIRCCGYDGGIKQRKAAETVVVAAWLKVADEGGNVWGRLVAMVASIEEGSNNGGCVAWAKGSRRRNKGGGQIEGAATMVKQGRSNQRWSKKDK